MKESLFILFGMLILLVGCSGDDKSNITNPENPEIEYVKGEVIVGLKDSVSLEQFAYFVYSLNNISIINIVSLQYYSTLPKDSMQTIKSNLESRKYITPGSVNVDYIESESKIHVKFWVKEFSYDDIKDWELIRTQLQLFHFPNEFQSGLLKVEVGKEKEWINILSNYNLFRFVELNYILHTTYKVN